MHATLAILLLLAPSPPQGTAPSVAPMTAPAESRRVVAWSHPFSAMRSAGLTQPFVYANRCNPSAWYPQCGVEAFVDTGRLPSPGSQPVVGGATSYRMEGLELGYVTSIPDPSLGGDGLSAELRFWSLGSSCMDTASLGAPDKVLVLHGLPGSDAPGSAQTIFVEVDLAAIGEDFVLLADGDGIYDHDATEDLFVWSFQFLGNVQGQAGPLLAGDPNQCPEGGGTVWSSAPGDGTGLGSRDEFRIETPVSPSPCGLTNACVSFAGLQNSFYLGLRADPVAAPSQPGYPFCFGVDCPCGNLDTDYGCANARGAGAFLMGAGTASAGVDDLVLSSFGLQANSFALLFHGGGAPLPVGFGNGRLCVGSGAGSLGLYRYGPPRATGPLGSLAVPGLVAQSQAFDAGGMIEPGDTWYFQVWYRDPGTCAQGSNMTNAYGVTFTP